MQMLLRDDVATVEAVQDIVEEVLLSSPFKIPENVLTICVGKSTYARCGSIVNVTPFEPGWQGRTILEISDTPPVDIMCTQKVGLAAR